MPKRSNDGVRKRCTCSKRNWSKCEHAWHFGFHRAGKEYRFSLDALARARGVHPPRTKDEANTWRDALRGEIKNGTFTDPTAAHPPSPSADVRLTFGDVVDRYVGRHVAVPTRR